MSAYICNRVHIIYLVTAAMSRRLNPHSSTFRWRHDGKSHEFPRGNLETAADIANLLWRENIKSVSHRYPGESSATLPGQIGENFVITPRDFPCFADIDPIEVLSAISCYEYQSCEHDEWEKSEAFAFCDSLRHDAIRALPGYEKAPWGAPDDFVKRLEEMNKRHAKV